MAKSSHVLAQAAVEDGYRLPARPYKELDICVFLPVHRQPIAGSGWIEGIEAQDLHKGADEYTL